MSAKTSALIIDGGGLTLCGFINTILPKYTPGVVDISVIELVVKLYFFKLILLDTAYINEPVGSISKSVTFAIDITELLNE